MDLSDGSDGEGDYELDENALLGSDDEEIVERPRYSTFGTRSSAKDADFQDEAAHAEDGDVLDLELNGEDGLEFADEPDGCSTTRVAPVRLAAISNKSETIGQITTNTDGYQHQMPDNYQEYSNEFDDSAGVDDDDDDDESRNTRTRFHNERTTDNISSNSQFQTFGEPSGQAMPIQTLGSGKSVPMVDNNHNQRNWGRHQGQNQAGQGPRPRFQHGMRNPLVGNRQQGNQNFNQFRQRGPRMNGPRNPNGLPPRPPYQGQMFGDFIPHSRIPNPHCPPHMREQIPPPFNQQPLLQRPIMQNQHPSNLPNIQGMGQINPRLPMRQHRPQMRPRGGTNMGHHHPRPNQWRNQLQQGPPQFPGMPMNPSLLGQPMPPNNMNFMPGPGHHGPNMFPPPQDPGHPHLFPEEGIRHEMQFNPFSGQPMQHFSQVGFPIPGGQQGQGPHGLSLMSPPIPEIHAHNIPQQNPFYQQQQQQPVEPKYMPPQQPSNRWPVSQPQPNSWNPNSGPLNFNAPQPIQSGQGDQQNGAFAHQHMPDHVHRTEETQNYSRSSYHNPNHDNYQQQRDYSSEDNRSQQHEQDRHTSRSDHDRKPEGTGSSHDRRAYQNRSESSRDHDRYPVKRKYDRHDNFDKPQPQRCRIDGPSTPPRDKKTDELLKIREEAKKTIGLDDEYIRKLEAQEKLREEVLRKKAASRKKLIGLDEPESARPTTAIPQKTSVRPSIYINPKAFTGDLSALKLKNVAQKGGERGSGTMHLYTNSAGITTKPRKVLKIVKDKYGNIISKSKVIVVPKQQPDVRTTSA